jgi:diguanylate cyclase (GGDEF)-like protein
MIRTSRGGEEEAPPPSGDGEEHRVESAADRRRRTTTPDALSIELVSAYAGDRVLTREEQEQLRLQQQSRGGLFFSDLLYSIAHQYFRPEIAETVWQSLLLHKRELSIQLARDVGIAVAALDYLSNVTQDLASPTLISEAHATELVGLSMRDGMTGLFNHTTCYELLELEFRTRERYGACPSLLLVDIDDFKTINDRGGHQEGDRVLVELAKALIDETRESDICCRFGGDEFAIILRLLNDSAEACQIAERICARANDIRSGDRRVGVSIGVATCGLETASPRDLVDKADRALYAAKRSGRGAVVLSSEP